MSRLDSFIRRVTAQRNCLNSAAALVEDLSGPVLELGLGNGRTYDHLRSLFGPDAIYVFDRHVKAHPDCIPDDKHMIIGDFTETVPAALPHLPGHARLIHCDIGSGDKSASLSLADQLVRDLSALLQSGGLVVSDQPFEYAPWEVLELPKDVAPGRYHMYRQK